MTGLARSFKKGSKWIGNTLTGGALEKPEVKEEPPIPLPDEEELNRFRRRRAARRTGGRSSTVLANDETFGP